MPNYNMTPDCGYPQGAPGGQMAAAPYMPVQPKRQMAAMPNMQRRQMAGRPSMSCAYPAKSDPLSGMAIAMAYVPWQFFHDVYEPEKALQAGTVFPELNQPFCGKGGCPK